MKTHTLPFLILKKKINLLQPGEFFQGTLERVRNSRGKRAISVRAIEVQLYFLCMCSKGVFSLNTWLLSILLLCQHQRTDVRDVEYCK